MERGGIGLHHFSDQSCAPGPALTKTVSTDVCYKDTEDVASAVRVLQKLKITKHIVITDDFAYAWKCDNFSNRDEIWHIL
jgi:hypothetical protein